MMNRRVLCSVAIIAAASITGHIHAQEPADVAAETSVVAGRVLDAQSGVPVRGATVRLLDTPFQVLTDSIGWFAFTAVTPGDYRVRIRHLRYGTQVASVTVPAGQVLALTFRASARPIVLDALEVEVISPAQLRRRATGIAHHVFISREEIEGYFQAGAFHVGDVLRMHDPLAARVWPRGLGGICIETVRRGTRPGCQMVAVLLDGFRIYGIFGARTLETFPLGGIEEIEFLPPLAAGFRYGLSGSAGAIAITTRRGGPGASRAAGGAELAQRLRERIERNRPRHWKHWAVGASLGAAIGVVYYATDSMLADGFDCGVGPAACEGSRVSTWLPILGGIGLGAIAGELVFRVQY